MNYDCPVCKQNVIKFEDDSPIKDKGFCRFVSICDNCNNVYCYKIEIYKEKDNV